MNIADAKQQIKDTVEAYLAKDDLGLYIIPQSRQRPIFLLGAPGIGKTAIMEQIAQELEIGLVSYSMTHHTRQSALGLPFIVHRDFEGMAYDASEYTMSEIISSIYDYMEQSEVKRGILFLDEVNCVSETLYPSMLQFLQFKTFGRHKVPDDWIIVCAGNPPEYNKSVHEYDIVTLDRLRKIVVEPDYSTWRTYALAQGVHPAITSFLEVKHDNFYHVETRPGEKIFVTARGWEDLSEIIKLFELTGKPVDLNLIGQFLQDEEIAERFSLYYDLFNKYRSDYQVDRILDGQAEPVIYERAQAAKFDERLALLGLLLDGIANRMGDVLDLEAQLVMVRDILREEKAPLLEGATVAETVGAAVRRREDDLNRMKEAGMASHERIRRVTQALTSLKRIIATCEMEHLEGGEPAFNRINELFKQEVSQLQPAAEKTSRQLDHGFEFVEQAFGDGREMLVFVTELTARGATSKFINRFGNDKYYEHNEHLMMEDRRKDLVTRIDNLMVEESGQPLLQEETIEVVEEIETSPSSLAPAPEIGGEVEGVVHEAPSIELRELRDYYRHESFEYGFVSMSKMVLPANLAGKTVLDIGCRRGKGVFKLSARVGAQGTVIGVDWDRAYIDEAVNRMDRAWHDNHLPKNNMTFRVAYPEDLIAGGVGDQSVDVVFVNSVLNLFYSREKSLQEMYRVLKPGGMLICQTVVADRERDPEIVKRAIEIGNSIQAAPARTDFEALMTAVGFRDCQVMDTAPVRESVGFKYTETAPTVDSHEEVTFKEITYHVFR